MTGCSLPDIKTKRYIFKIHTSRMSLADDVDLEEFVHAKDELSGADIKAVCTEAGLLALRERRMRVTMADLRQAREKTMFAKKDNGPEGLCASDSLACGTSILANAPSSIRPQTCDLSAPLDYACTAVTLTRTAHDEEKKDCEASPIIQTDKTVFVNVRGGLPRPRRSSRTQRTRRQLQAAAS